MAACDPPRTSLDAADLTTGRLKAAREAEGAAQSFHKDAQSERGVTLPTPAVTEHRAPRQILLTRAHPAQPQRWFTAPKGAQSRNGRWRLRLFRRRHHPSAK